MAKRLDRQKQDRVTTEVERRVQKAIRDSKVGFPGISAHVQSPTINVNTNKLEYPVSLRFVHTSSANLGYGSRVVARGTLVLNPFGYRFGPKGQFDRMREHIHGEAIYLIDQLMEKAKRNAWVMVGNQIDQLYKEVFSPSHMNDEKPPGELVELLYDTLVVCVHATGVEPEAWKQRRKIPHQEMLLPESTER